VGERADIICTVNALTNKTISH